MIHIFPLIVSKTVNTNILPSVAKVLEHYILVYQLDKVTTHGRIISTTKSFSSMIQKKLGLNEQSIPPGSAPGQKPGYGPKDDKSTTNIYKKGAFKIDNRETKDGGVFTNTKGISTKSEFDKNSLAVQPTWITLDTGHGVKLVGVKVVPYLVDDKDIVDLLMYDKNLSGFSHFVTAAERKIASMAYSIWGSTFRKVLDAVTFGTLGSNPITGNPKDDVILGNTDFKKNVFVMLNSMNVPEDFSDNMGTTKKLFSLGWSSLIINDDVNKKVTFCMTEFNGMCHSVSHSFLHAGLGKEIKTAYDDLNDVKSASNPIFAKMVRPSNLNNLFQEKLDYYDSLRYLMEQENTDFTKIVKAVRTKNYDAIDKALGGDGGTKSVRTFEKVKWHDNNPEMKNTVIDFLEDFMIYLNNNLLLNNYGRELFELNGVDDHFTLSSDMLSDKGLIFVSNNYTKLLHKFSESKEFDSSFADSILKSMNVPLDGDMSSSIDQRVVNTYKLLSTDKQKFTKSLEVSRKVLQNSLPNVPGAVTNSFANIIALRSSEKGSGFIDQTKADLKDTIGKLRAIFTDDKKHSGWQKETTVAVITLFLVLAAGIGFASMVLFKRRTLTKIYTDEIGKMKNSVDSLSKRAEPVKKATSNLFDSIRDFKRGQKP